MSRFDKDNPCKPDCPDRSAVPNCHSDCPKYLEWRKHVDEEKKKIKEYNIKNGVKNTKLYTSKTLSVYKRIHKKRKDGY